MLVGCLIAFSALAWWQQSRAMKASEQESKKREAENSTLPQRIVAEYLKNTTPPPWFVSFLPPHIPAPPIGLAVAAGVTLSVL